MVNSHKELVAAKKKELSALTQGFCGQYLGDEYVQVTQKLIDKMARKRQVPFLSGRMEIWAGAVVHAIGLINFVFDKDSKPYISVGDICAYFNVNQSTMTQKSKFIRDMFKMNYFDPEFSTATNAANNPLDDIVLINGFYVPRGMLK